MRKGLLKILISIFFLTTLLAFITGCNANDGLLFNYINNGTEYEVAYYNGDASEIVIPTSYKNKPVTRIGKNAFANNLKLTKVVIPNSIKRIEDSAFNSCLYLENVVFEQETQLETIDKQAFFDCSSLKDLTIPLSVKNIEEKAFSGCSSLEIIKIPYSVSIIKEEVFAHCDLLRTVEIPMTITNICKNAFTHCNNLRNVIFQDDSSLRYIEEFAFSNCQLLSIITIPASVIEIGEGAFYSCQSLHLSFEENSKLERISSSAFSKCYSLGTKITIPNKVTSIGVSAFSSCIGISEVTIPSSVISIESSAFENCYNLEKVTFGQDSKLENIGETAFIDCDLLKEIIIAKSVKTIGYYAFSKCDALQSVVFENDSQLESIGRGVFYACPLLQTNIDGGLKYIASQDNPYFMLIGVEYDNLKAYTINSNTKIVVPYVFENLEDIELLIIPRSVEIIEPDAIYQCSFKVYCEAESLPENWRDWNKYNLLTVTWNYNVN